MATSGRPDDLQALLATVASRGQSAAAEKAAHSAFSALYERTSAKLFGVALRILKREDWAEEVLQDCFVNVWNSAATYQSALAAPMTWLTSIVRNKCLDGLRRPQREVSADIDHEDGEESLIDRIADESPGPLEQLASARDGQALAACLDTLDRNQRQVIMLAFFEGLSHAELAAQTSHPLGTVKTWVRRGLDRLKSRLTTSTGGIAPKVDRP